MKQVNQIFSRGTITAFPTDTSFGLGVRADDGPMLQRLYKLKQRPKHKYSSLMVKDWAMLQQFAEVPPELPSDFFTTQPRTVLLKPKRGLPVSEFWPVDKVGFRVAPRADVAAAITYPITATSANFSGQPAIYSPAQIVEQFGSTVMLFPNSPELDSSVPASEIWDYSRPSTPVQIR